MLSTGVSYIIFLTRKTDKYKIKLNNNNNKKRLTTVILPFRMRFAAIFTRDA